MAGRENDTAAVGYTIDAKKRTILLLSFICPFTYLFIYLYVYLSTYFL